MCSGVQVFWFPAAGFSYHKAIQFYKLLNSHELQLVENGKSKTNGF